MLSEKNFIKSKAALDNSGVAGLFHW